MISQPDDVTICEGEEAVFTCVLNSNIRSDDVQWYRFIKDTSTTVMVDPNEENIDTVNHANGSTSSSLTITNAIKSYTGYFWVETPSHNCNASLTVLASMYICVYISNNYAGESREHTLASKSFFVPGPLSISWQSCIYV